MQFFFLFIVCIAGIVFCLYLLLGRTNPRLPVSRVTIAGKIFNAERAETLLARTRGLSGRDSLPQDGGMIFFFSTPGNNGFWMKDMRFPIEIVWIRENKVIGFEENMQPEPGKPLWSLKMYYPPENIDTVLEIHAGAVKKYGFKVGDMVSIR